MPSIVERAQKAWDAFKGRDPTRDNYYLDYQFGSGRRPDRPQFGRGNAKMMVTSIYNQISIDCAAIDIKHVKLDEEMRYESTIEDSLNNILTTEANIDQTGRAFIQDLVITMLDEGAVALVPVRTDVDPQNTDAYKVLEARTGKIIQWYPTKVKVSVYNEARGKRQEIMVDKRYTPIINNPFYATMNEPNSTVKRLTRVLNQLDRSNEQNSSNKLDLLVQLPYQIKTEAKRNLVRQRQQDLTNQLAQSEYGVAYLDATEKVVQLNRSLENNLWNQAEKLQADLYNQLGFTETIFNGSADEQTMLNYYSRTIQPIMSAIAEEIARKWISKTARTQRHTIMFFRDPFKLVPVEKLAEISDKFTRNEIMSSNEIRSVIGLKPSDDPRADELINSNLNHPDEDPRTNIDKDQQAVEIQNQ